LLGPFQFETPRGHAVDATIGEISTREVCVHQDGRLEPRPAEVRPLEVRVAEVRPVEVRSAKVRPAEVRLAEVRPAEARVAEVRPAVAATAEADRAGASVDLPEERSP
jgi:hypothetical protein